MYLETSWSSATTTTDLPARSGTWKLQLPLSMWRDGVAASVSSLLIMLVLHPLARNAVLMGRRISRYVAKLLALHGGGGGVVVLESDTARRRHCERCGEGEGEGGGEGLSGSDVAAVMKSLGMAGRHGWDEDGGEEGLCGGCEAVRVAEELEESRSAGEAELREAFGMFDRDGDGLVCAGELWRVLRRLGMAEGARYEDCERMVAAARSTAGGGGVSFVEFRAMMEEGAA